MIAYVMNRLKEVSTWKGLIFIVTAVGVHLTPEQASAMVAAGLGIVGVINTFLPDKIPSVAK